MNALKPMLCMQSLRSAALVALASPSVATKIALVRELNAAWTSDSEANTGSEDTLCEASRLPGQPDKPALLAHLDLPQRSIQTAQGLAALVHSVCHIEFNAINLALDAVWRFANMPDDYYRDWTRVAKEEAYHFDLLRTHLKGVQQNADGTAAYDYGCFPAHGGLWDMCEKTKDDVTARMALVPRTLEARGLDATPLIQAKMRKTNTAPRQGSDSDFRHHSARRNRPCGHWQPLVQLVMQAGWARCCNLFSATARQLRCTQAASSI
jgi:uncharacterized ferritin-like protein (DUF455 family)